MKTCKKCGTPLRETTHDSWWCPNCFEYGNEEEKIEIDIEELKQRSYLN